MCRTIDSEPRFSIGYFSRDMVDDDGEGRQGRLGAIRAIHSRAIIQQTIRHGFPEFTLQQYVQDVFRRLHEWIFSKQKQS